MKRIITSVMFVFGFIALYAQNTPNSMYEYLMDLDQATLDSIYETIVEENPEIAENTVIKGLFVKEHMKFKGLEIDGTIEEFHNKLKNEIPDLDGMVVNNGGIFTGTFAGTRGCTIILLPNAENEVRDVSVQFPSTDSWTVLKKNYDELCDNIKHKYGEPSAIRNDFTPPYKDGAGNEIQGILQSQIMLCQTFELRAGYIQVCILPASKSNATIADIVATQKQAAVSIIYHDYKNSMADEYAKYNDL